MWRTLKDTAAFLWTLNEKALQPPSWHCIFCARQHRVPIPGFWDSLAFWPTLSPGDPSYRGLVHRTSRARDQWRPVILAAWPQALCSYHILIDGPANSTLQAPPRKPDCVSRNHPQTWSLWAGCGVHANQPRERLLTQGCQPPPHTVTSVSPVQKKQARPSDSLPKVCK